MKPTGGSKRREGTCALLLSTDDRLLLQLRDNLPHITDPGMISLFGGRREDDETFLDCVVREVHEEIGYYLPPERFELIGRYCGSDYATPDGTVINGEVFLAREVPAESLTITEGRLKIVALDELEQICCSLAPLARFALEIFLKREQAAKR